MSGEISPHWKIVTPVKCNEKPWDSWVHEIGHSSPRQEEDTTTTTPAAASGRPCDGKANGGRRAGRKDRRYRRSGLNRLRTDTMSLHGLFPQSDNLNAAVCHMCGATVKCSAVYRHLLDSHTSAEPILPPPPPAPTVKLKSLHRSRLKKELPPPPPPLPIEIVPLKLETSPIHTAPLTRVVLPQQEDLQYLEEASTLSAVTGEVQVCVESGELPVVSIQDTDDLHLGENITDDIFAIMNSEGIQSAEDIANCPDWKNIIRDIGNMQDINFGQGDSVQAPDVYGTVDASTLPAYTLPEELSNVQYAASVAPVLPTVIDANSMITTQVLKQTPIAPPPPLTKSQSRSKSSKTKFALREYDANKHCGVVTAENPKPCTRSLTCKAHALSLRRLVEGRVKPFDTLLAEHRASREAAAAPPPVPVPAPAPPPPLDLAAFNGLTAEQQVQDIYASLLSVEEGSALPEATFSSLLVQPLPTEPFLLPDEAEVVDLPVISIAEPPDRPPPPSLMQPLHLDLPIKEESPPAPVPTEICWYATSPRPLALCTFNASHAGGAVTLGKRFATVRNNIKSSLSRSQKAGGGGSGASAGGYGFAGSTLGSRAGASRSAELRRLVARCGAMASRRLPNGHVQPPSVKQSKRTPTSSLLDLGFVLDPLLADDKC